MKDKNLVEYETEELTLENFKPTEKMIKWVTTAADPAVPNVISEISRITGISRETWRQWNTSPTFVEWYNKIWAKLMSENNWYLDKIGLKNAAKDFKFWEAMQIKYGGYKKTLDVTSNGEPLSAGIFVVDFKKQLRGEDVEIRTAVRSEVVEGEVIPANDATKQAVEPLERTINSERPSDTPHKPTKLNPIPDMDLSMPKGKEFITKTVVKPVRIKKLSLKDYDDFAKENKKLQKRSKKVNMPLVDSTTRTAVNKSVKVDGEWLPVLDEVF